MSLFKLGFKRNTFKGAYKINIPRRTFVASTEIAIILSAKGKIYESGEVKGKLDWLKESLQCTQIGLVMEPWGVLTPVG